MREATPEEAQRFGHRVTLITVSSIIITTATFVLITLVLVYVFKPETAPGTVFTLMAAYVTCTSLNLVIISSATVRLFEELKEMLEDES